MGALLLKRLVALLVAHDLMFVFGGMVFRCVDVLLSARVACSLCETVKCVY